MRSPDRISILNQRTASRFTATRHQDHHPGELERDDTAFNLSAQASSSSSAKPR
jgi:hypothetical protein